MVDCVFCPAPAVSGVESLARDEYYPVCAEDLARLESEHGMVACDLRTHYTCEGCGDVLESGDTCWDC